jgi:hypothetical protein
MGQIRRRKYFMPTSKYCEKDPSKEAWPRRRIQPGGECKKPEIKIRRQKIIRRTYKTTTVHTYVG